jgi:predicted MFS family arabinose efflux permease
VLVAGSIVFAGLMLCLAHSGAVVASVIALGLVSGQPAGAVMSLPARVLQPATRAVGMGVFYTVYYAAMMLGPIIGGEAAKWTGRAAAAFDFGALALVICPLLLLLFNAIAAQPRS